METIALTSTTREPWNKGKLVGQKTPFKLKEIWAIRVRDICHGQTASRALVLQRQDQTSGTIRNHRTSSGCR
jgi:hypothetical protein